MAAPPHSRRSITRARTMYRYWGIEELHITHLRTQIQNKLGAYCQFKWQDWLVESYNPLYRGASGCNNPVWLLVTLADSNWKGFDEPDSSRESRSKSVFIIVLSWSSCKLLADSVDKGWWETPVSFSGRFTSLRVCQKAEEKGTGLRMIFIATKIK